MGNVIYEDERTKFRVRIRPATYRDDLRRLDMMHDAAQKVYDNNDYMVAAVFTYPRLISVAPFGELELDGQKIEWPPTLDQVLDMSVEAVNAWYDEVRKLNPTWFDYENIAKKMMETQKQSEKNLETKQSTES